MILFENHGLEENELFRTFTLKDYQFPIHCHHACELIYVDKGSLFITVDDQEYRLNQQDLIFVFNNQLHEFKTIDASKITVILFSPELIGDFFKHYKGCIPKDNRMHLATRPNFDALNSLYRQKSFLYSICADLIKSTSFVDIKQNPQRKVLYKMLLYIDQNYSSDCTLKAVAKHLRYDYPYLSKLFVKRVNMTFTEYLNHYRISQTCYLLRNTDQSIGEIARNCGYNNLRTFHRNFKGIMNQSPKNYRDI